MSVLSPALLGAVALVLLAAAGGHLRNPVALRSGLLVHGVLPASLRRPVALLLPVAELVLAGTALSALAGVGDPVLLTRLAGGGAFLLFAGFTVYLLVVLRTNPGPGVPCACGIGEAAVGPPSVLRAALLGLFAVVAASGAQGWTVTGGTAAEVAVTLAAAGSLALATALLPAAREVPADLTLHDLSPRGVR